MATTASFDVTTGVDLQEVDNAINQAQKEVVQPYAPISRVPLGGLRSH